MSLNAEQVWRDYVIDGDPISGAHKPVKSEIRDLFDDMTQGPLHIFDSRAEAVAATIEPGRDNLQLLGYSTPGDGGGAFYRRVVTEPIHGGKFQSADGAWWELTEPNAVTLEMFGGKADGSISGTSVLGTDNFPIFKLALEYARESENIYYDHSATIQLLRGKYRFSGRILIDHNVKIAGACGPAMGNTYPGSVLLFPQNTSAFYFKSYLEVNPDTGLASSKNSNGALLEGVRLDTPAGSTDITKHAAIIKSAVRIKDCQIFHFGGDGVNIYAWATGGGAENTGNANLFELRTLNIVGCQNGIYVNGPDANAGNGYNISVISNRAWGIFDDSFLGNTWHDCHASANGLGGQVHYAGNRYSCINAALGGTTTPGTNSAVWLFQMVGGVHPIYPEWVSGATYVEGGSYAAAASSSRSLFSGCYTEGDQPPPYVNSPNMIVGGLMATNRGTGLQIGVKGSIAQFHTGQKYAGVGSGGMLTKLSDAASNGIEFIHGDDHQTGLGLIKWDATNKNYITQWAGSAASIPVRYMAQGNLLTGGRVAPLAAGQVAFGQGLWLGGTTANIRNITNLGAIPTVAGEYARGDIILNFAPTAGGKIGWVVTTGGTIAPAWVSGTNYNTNSYILSSGGRYYRCTTDGGTSSVNEPVHTSGTVTEADGFAWLYLGTVAPVFNAWGAIDGIEASVAYDPPSLAAGAVAAVQTLAVTGAALGDYVDASFSVNLNGLVLNAWVSAANVVSYQFSNPAGAAGPVDVNGTVRVRVRKF